MIKKRRSFICGIKGFNLSNREIKFLKKFKPWGVILFKRNIKTINQDFLLALILLSLFSNFLLKKNILIHSIDTLSIIIINWAFSPLVAFTIYFCFLHSIRHSFSFFNELI